MIDRVVSIRRGDCPCPGKPHPEETVTLLSELTLPIAAGAYTAMRNAEPTLASQQAALTSAFLPSAIEAWTFMEKATNGDLQPVEINRENMERLIPWDLGGLEVADRADSLYSERLMRPLVARMSQQSPDGPMAEPIPPTPPSGDPPPVPLRRSSRGNGDGRRSGVPVP